MGLNDSYTQLRSQIQLMIPWPSVNKAYAIIVSDTGQKSIVNIFSSLLEVASHVSYESTTLYSKFRV